MSDNVHSLHRIQYQGKPTDSVKLVWKSDAEDPPGKLPLYKDIDESPLLHFQQMEPRQPRCYHCQELGHIQYHCKNKDDESGQYGRRRRLQEPTGHKAATVKKPCGVDNAWDCICRTQRLLYGNDNPRNNVPNSEIPPMISVPNNEISPMNSVPNTEIVYTYTVLVNLTLC